jgi:hypothetical protein
MGGVLGSSPKSKIMGLIESLEKRARQKRDKEMAKQLERLRTLFYYMNVRISPNINDDFWNSL